MGNWKYLALLGIFLCGGFTIAFSEASFYKIRKIECKINAEILDNVSCVVKPISWTRSVLNLEGDLKDNVTEVKDLQAIVDIFYKDSSNMFKPFGVKLNFNICQLLAKKKQGNFLEEYAVHHLRTLTNVNHSCPISGHIYARDFYFDELTLPPVPLQDYKVAFNFSYSKPARNIGLIFVFFEVFEDYYKNKKPKSRPRALILN
ncbi:uncharacterized protein [Drosophila kikkawai]|uniref:Uncharacterized protein n=1 Tax=Drosophila kikkawai TaxID=30033 RepID=A0ABM4GCQ2_DROKI